MASNLVKINDAVYSHFEVFNDAIVISDTQGSIIFANRKAEQLLGYSADELLGQCQRSIFSKSLIELTDDNVVFLASRNNFHNLPHGSNEKLISTGNGSPVWIRWVYSHLENGDLLQLIEDITYQKELEEQVEQLRSQNVILQQEVHHRIKNNMQIVMSLLNLQFQKVTDQKALHSLAKSKERMLSISIVHDYLCSSKNLSVNSFGIYLNKFLTFIENGNKNGRAIRLKATFSGHFRNNRHFVSLGLIISELVTNAYKHAFQSNKGGIISVSLNCEKDGQVVLCVADNGRGLRPPLNLEMPGTLGYEIILSLVHQIEGRISITSEKGTKVSVIYYQ